MLKGTPLERLMPERIRRRRETRGLSGAELARRAHVSAAYVSQIETGKRVPDVKVALVLARVLEDDEGLYAAWSRDFKAGDRSAAGRAGEGAAWTSLYSSGRFGDDAAFRSAVRSGEDIAPPRGRAAELVPALSLAPPARPTRLFDSSEEDPGSVERELLAQLELAEAEGRKLVSAPVLAPGVDPGDEDEISRALQVDRMVLDPRFLPSARLGRPFVFKADAEVARRVPDRVEPGDLVIVSRDLAPGDLGAERIYALRLGGRVELGRVARVGDRHLVLPAPGRTELEDVGLVAGRAPRPRVAGEVVAVLKLGAR
jgi:transcriptional regulator with XRE-family HTH domain